LINGGYRSQLSLFLYCLCQYQLSLIFLFLSWTPSQDGKVDKVQYPKAYREDEHILQPWRHEIVQFDYAVIAMVFQYLALRTGSCFDFPGDMSSFKLFPQRNPRNANAFFETISL